METTPLEKIPGKRRVYCNRCRGDTSHECVCKSERSEEDWSDEESHPTFVEDWIFVTWRCLGCQAVSLEERYTNWGMHDEDGEQVWSSEVFPARTRAHLKPKFFTSLPKQLATIYKESVISFNSSAPLLCAVGLRALIEGVCNAKKIKGKNLQERIDGLATILPTSIVKNLHGLRFMGNTAVHELEPPPKHDLRLAIEVCEDLLNYLYELDYKTARFGRLVQARLKMKNDEKKEG